MVSKSIAQSLYKFALFSAKSVFATHRNLSPHVQRTYRFLFGNQIPFKTILSEVIRFFILAFFRGVLNEV